MDDKNFNDPKTALDWSQSIENSRLREQDIYPRLGAWVDTISAGKILEIGCGQGICSKYLPLTNREYIGLEPSPFLLDRAKQLYADQNRSFLSGNAYALPFGPGEFDAVFSVTVWHLISDLKKATEEMSRVLKPKGHFLIITANPTAYSAWTDRYTSGKLVGSRFEGRVQLQDHSESKDVLYLHPLETILASLQAEGLKVELTETFRPTAPSSPQVQHLYISIQGRKI